MNRFIKYLLHIPAFVCLVCISSHGQEVWPGGTSSVGGSYNLTFPTGPFTYPANPPSTLCGPVPAVNHYQRPGHNYFRSAVESPKVVSGFSQLPQTNDWWSSAIWNYETTCNWVNAPYSFWMYPHPLQVAGTRYGLKVGYETTPAVVWNTYIYQSEPHLYIGLNGMDVPASQGMRVKSYSDWAATFQWDDGTRVMEATSAHGSPYVYFTKNASSSFTIRYQVNPGAAFATINNSSVHALGVNILGKYYGIFLPPGSTLSSYYGLTYNEANVPAEVPTANATRDARTVSTPLGHNYMSICILPDNNPATLAYYAQFAFAFITDTKVSWNYQSANSSMASTFTITTSPQGTSTETKTLTALYRHQWLNTSAPMSPYSYVSSRGQMKVTEGSSFTTNIKQYGLLSGLPNVGTHNKATLYAYVDAIHNDNVGNVAHHMNHFATMYDVGVKMERMVNLIHLADAVGHANAKSRFIGYLKTALEYWLRSPAGKSNQMLWYDPLWRTLVGLPQAFESDRQLNDHHFHYGYFVKAAATIVQYESNDTWLSQWGPMVEHLIRDVAAWDRSDTQYPFLRYFDVFAGHSWASGHSNFQQGNNQESSSEALNFAAAVALYGTNSGNTTLRDLGMFLYANEVAATQQYWFDVDNAVFPASWDKEAAGIVWGRSVEYQTWFGGDPEYVHGINYLPITGSSFYLAWDSNYTARNYAGMVTQNGGPETVTAAWRDLFWMYQALSDPLSAKSKFLSNAASYIPQTGQSRPYTYLWISMLDSIGKPTQITADIPTYSVFRKGNCYHYVIYNPPANVPGNPYTGAKTVTFSDGFVVSVPSDTTIVFKRCITVLPVVFGSFSAQNDENQVVLNWRLQGGSTCKYIEIQHSTDGLKWESIGIIHHCKNIEQFIDENPSAGLGYYRIKAFGPEEEVNISSIRSVYIGKKDIFYHSYENGFLNIYLSSDYSEFSIYDIQGKRIYQSTDAQMGTLKTSLDVRLWPVGTYLIKHPHGVSKWAKWE